MTYERLKHSVRVEEGEWIRSRLGHFALDVTALVPAGFNSYVRILHPVPLPGRPGQEKEEFTSWREVAARTGRTMHPLVQFVSIAGTRRSALRARAGAYEPREGHLEPATLERLCRVLAPYTTTPDHCWFALWEGYGWMDGSPSIAEMVLVPGPPPPTDALRHEAPDPMGSPPRFLPPPQRGGRRAPTKPGDPGYVPPAFPREVRGGPRFEIPHRAFYLFEGPLDAAGELGHRPRPDVFFPQSPNMFWPDDQAWCVATEIDLKSTYVAGSDALAEALLVEPGLEVFRVGPGDAIDHASDKVNPYEGSAYD